MDYWFMTTLLAASFIGVQAILYGSIYVSLQGVSLVLPGLQELMVLQELPDQRVLQELPDLLVLV
jgi:hypothetical protein